MAFSDRIEVALGLNSSAFVSSLRAVRADVAAADGFMNKLSAGAAGLGGAFKAAASSPAVLGTAIAGAGTAMVNLVGDAQNLALEVGKLSDATGLATQDAGRWKEVVEDSGGSIAAFEKSVGFMNKTLGNTPGEFTAAGVAITDMEGRALSTQDVLLNVVDRLDGIKSPAEKAALASKLLGRGWQEMSELIGKGSEELKRSLSEVSETKAITPEQVQEAREMRDQLDNLKDSAQELGLEIGQTAIPMVLGLVEALGKLKESTELWIEIKDRAFGNANDAFHNSDFEEAERKAAEAVEATSTAMAGQEAASARLRGMAERYRTTMADVAEANEKAAAAISETDRETRRAGSNVGKTGDAFAEMAADVDTATDALHRNQDAVLSSINEQFAFENALDSAGDAARDYADATADASASEEDRSDALRDAKQSAVDAAAAYAAMRQAGGDTTDSVQLMIDSLRDQAAMLAPGNPLRNEIEGYIAQLEGIPDSVSTKVTLDVTKAINDAKTLAANLRALQGVKTATPNIALRAAPGAQGRPAGDGLAGTAARSSGNVSAVFTPAAAEEVAQAETKIVEEALVDQGRLDREEMERKYRRRLISRDQYLAFLDEQQAAEDAANGQSTALAVELFEMRERLREEAASLEQAAIDESIRLAEEAAAAVEAAEKRKQEAIKETARIQAEANAAALEAADADADLVDAIRIQEAAVAALAKAQKDGAADVLAAEQEAWIIGMDRKATQEDKDRALAKVQEAKLAMAEKIRAAEEALAKATVAGAEARAREKGLTGIDAARDVASQISEYLKNNADPTGILANAILRNTPGGNQTRPAAGGSTFTVYVNAGLGANGNDIGGAVVNAIKQFENRNGSGWRAS